MIDRIDRAGVAAPHLLSPLGRAGLLIAFTVTVMADPVSSVAYAIEAALRALSSGRLDLLLPTMALVVGIIALITVSYHQLVARFPAGGGAVTGAALGEGGAVVPLGALSVAVVLTLALSVAAGSSALVAYLPAAGAGVVRAATPWVRVVCDTVYTGAGSSNALRAVRLYPSSARPPVVVLCRVRPRAGGRP